MGESIRVFVLADNRLLRDALTRVITRKGDIEAVGSAAFSKSSITDILDSNFDVLLIDWASAGQDLLELLSAFRRQWPHRKAILIGVKSEPQSLLEVVEAGIQGILLDDAAASDIAAAVRAVMNQSAVCPPELCLHLFEHVYRQARNLPNAWVRTTLGLTRREQQLVPLIARGLTNKEIALRLNLSEQTVKNHIHHMLRKTGVSDRLDVVEACNSRGAFPRSYAFPQA